MFPYSESLLLKDGSSVSAQNARESLLPLLTQNRRQRIQSVAAGRCFDVVIATEGLYDRGNISAVLRTGEGLGFANFHVIETLEKFKEANRVTQGADKWVHIQKWKTTKDFVAEMRRQKKQIIVTALSEKAKPLNEIDFTRPSALVLGNEKSGATPEMIESADEVALIPMSGFVQSFNISVAGALCMYEILRQRQTKLGRHADVTGEQEKILHAYYAYETLDSADDILRREHSHASQSRT